MTVGIIPVVSTPSRASDRPNIVTQYDTAHDWRPTHSFKPAWVVQAQEEATEAWQARDAIIDASLEAGEWDQAALDAATADALDADDRYHELYRCWQLGYEPAELPNTTQVDIIVHLAEQVQ